MSKIYRSREQAPPIHNVDLRDTPMGPQNPLRPPGGIMGLSGLASDGTPLSAFERREHEARQLIESAHRQAENIQAEAYHAGFEEGERAGQKLTRQKLEPLLQNLSLLLQGIQQQRAALIGEHEQELIKVAFAVATQIVKHEIATNSPGVVAVINAALAKVSHAQHVKLHLAPIDAQLLESQLSLQDDIRFPRDHFTIVPDDEVGRGGCRVLTETGDIDAMIETQLRVLREHLWQSDETAAHNDV